MNDRSLSEVPEGAQADEPAWRQSEQWSIAIRHLRSVGIGDDDEDQPGILEGELTLDDRLRRNLPDMLKIGRAAYLLQQRAMQRARTDQPQGPRYRAAWRGFATPKLRLLSPPDRKHFIWIWTELERVQSWYDTLPQNQRDQWKWHSPLTIKNKIEPPIRRTPAGGGRRPRTPATDPAEVVRIQEELDRVRAELDSARTRLRRAGQDPTYVTEEAEWSWRDEPEDIARRWLDPSFPHRTTAVLTSRRVIEMLHPAEALAAAQALIRRHNAERRRANQATSSPRRRSSPRRAPRPANNPTSDNVVPFNGPTAKFGFRRGN
jgi:hypothetical protein